MQLLQLFCYLHLVHLNLDLIGMWEARVLRGLIRTVRISMLRAYSFKNRCKSLYLLLQKRYM
jgi:hypothetical protein